MVTLAVVAGLAFLWLLHPGAAGAYPNGWTVQQRPVASGALNCDMDAYYSYVCLAWQKADGSIALKRSSDSGATWSGEFVVEDGIYENGPPTVVFGSPASQSVYVIWAGKRDGNGCFQTWIACSNDWGSTFPASSRWHSTGSSNKTEQDACLPRDSNEIIWTYTNDAGGTDEVYWGKIAPGGTVTTNGRLSSADGIESHQAVVACKSGAGAMAVWTDEAGAGYTRRHLVCGRTTNAIAWGAPGSGPLPSDSAYRQGCPSAFWAEQYVVVAYRGQRVDNGHFFFGRYYFDPARSAWSPSTVGQSVQVDTGAAQTCPETVGSSSGDCFFKNGGGTLSLWDSVTNFLGAETVAAGAHSIALASADPDHDAAIHYAAATTTDGEVYFRREDTRPTAARLTTPAFNGGGPFNTNADFRLECAGAADDYPADGIDIANGKRFSNGFESVTYTYTANEATWGPLPCKEGHNVATTAPFTRTVDTTYLNQRGIKIKTTAVDSAGNTADWISPWVVIDKDSPSTTLRKSGTAGEGGFFVSAVSASFKTDDCAPTTTFYRLENLANGRSDSGWKTYRDPFRLSEGRWRLHFYSVDRAGNAEREKTSRVLIDKTPPVPAITRPLKDTIQTGYSSPDSFRLRGTATDANGLSWSGIYVDGVLKYETRREFDMAYVWSLGGVSEGNHKITVKAADPAGNRGAVSKTVYVGNTAKDWYFAEGNTLPEFDEFLCVLNPGDAETRYRISFMLDSGEVRTFERSMSAHQRDTVRVKDYIPEPHGGVAVKIHCDGRAIIAERPMYFVYKAGDPNYCWKGGHDVMGINVLQNEWYFAEGTTRFNDVDGAFEEWICLLNPSDDRTADVVITYMLGTGQNVRKLYAIPPHSRYTVEVAGDVGLNQDVSAKVASSVPIAAERPMYFNYHGYAVDGSNVVGASGPSTYWSFAEGCTRAGFQEWLTVQNPGDVIATCRINYLTGKGRVTEVVQKVGPRSRATVDVLSQVGDNQDVSTTVTSDVPVIAERPMYFIYGMDMGKFWSGGESVLGNPAPSATYFLAEGTTISRFDTFYTLANPRAAGCDVTVRYMFADGSTQASDYRIEAHSRLTINVRDAIGREADVSGSITASFPIVVERPMYFQYNQAITGGHDASGYGID